jgi:hypothetical protein
MEDFKELRRRIIVIPTRKIEDIPEERKIELGLPDALENILNPDEIDWDGCSKDFASYWDLPRCERWLKQRRTARQKLKGLKSTQVTICADLATTGVVSGVWKDFREASDRLFEYFVWLDREQSECKSDLLQVIESIISQERDNCAAANLPLTISNQSLRYELSSYEKRGWLTEKPSAKTVLSVMQQLGFNLVNGTWRLR